jgi:hypothetical protein
MTDVVTDDKSDARMFVIGDVAERLKLAGFNSKNGVMWATGCYAE